MTSIGLKTLDLFFQCLHDRSPKRKKVLTDRDVNILSRYYEWEEPEADIVKTLSLEWNLTTERIRQISVEALLKMDQLIYPGFNPIAKLRFIIDNYTTPGEKGIPSKTLARFCTDEFAGVDSVKIVQLMSALWLRNKSEVKKVKALYEAEKIRQNKELRNERLSRLKELKRDSRFAQFLDTHIVWFDNAVTWTKDHFDGWLPRRTVSVDKRYHSGVVYSRKTKQNVQYESGVEHKFIEELESSSIVAHYLEQPFRLKYTRRNVEHIYTPDFAVLLNDGRCFIAEVKGNFHDIMDARLHRAMEVIIPFCEQHGLGLLINVGHHSYDYLVRYPINASLEKVIEQKLDERRGRTIFRNEFLDILEKTGAKSVEALAVILKNNWGYYPFPLKLNRKNPYDLFRSKVIGRFM